MATIRERHIQHRHVWSGERGNPPLVRCRIAWDCRTPFGYALAGEPIPIEGTVTNKGLATIHSLTFSYKYGNNTSTETISGLDIAYLESMNVQLQGLSFNESGNYELTVELAAINDNPDLSMDDNTSASFPIQCFNEMEQRNVLLEVFTTELCPIALPPIGSSTH